VFVVHYVVTEYLVSSSFILFLCSLILVLICLLVCLTYETSHSLHWILYTTLFLDIISVASLWAFIFALSHIPRKDPYILCHRFFHGDMGEKYYTEVIHDPTITIFKYKYNKL